MLPLFLYYVNLILFLFGLVNFLKVEFWIVKTQFVGQELFAEGKFDLEVIVSDSIYHFCSTYIYSLIPFKFLSDCNMNILTICVIVLVWCTATDIYNTSTITINTNKGSQT